MTAPGSDGRPRLNGPNVASAAAPLEVARQVRLSDRILDYTLRRSRRARHLRVTVDPVRGVVVPIAQSVTIEVDLFSDAKMDPFYVKAIDVPSYLGKSAELAFSFDRESGQNGEKLHLTITRTAKGSQYGGTEFAILAYSDPTHYHQWMGYAANAP